MNADETHKEDYSDEPINEELNKEAIVERIPIKHSPFWLLRVNSGWFIAMGDHRLTELMKTKPNITEYMRINMWQLIMQMTIITQRMVMKETIEKPKK